MVDLEIEPTIVVPLQTDEHGTIRVGGTGVTLDSIIYGHRRNETPEFIQAGFPAVKLADIYAVITYYLNHQAEVDDYLKEQEDKIARIRREWEQSHPEHEAFRAKLRAAKAAQLQQPSDED